LSYAKGQKYVFDAGFVMVERRGGVVIEINSSILMV